MKKILIVDDEKEICELVQRTVQKTGKYHVIATTIPEEVVQLCTQEKPHLILLDIVMPGIEGTELIKVLKENPATKHIKIVVTSGLGEMSYSQKEDKWYWLPNRPIVEARGEVIHERSAERAAEAYGVDDYIAKPFSSRILLEVIEEVLREKGPQDPKNNN